MLRLVSKRPSPIPNYPSHMSCACCLRSRPNTFAFKVVAVLAGTRASVRSSYDELITSGLISKVEETGVLVFEGGKSIRLERHEVRACYCTEVILSPNCRHLIFALLFSRSTCVLYKVRTVQISRRVVTCASVPHTCGTPYVFREESEKQKGNKK